MNSLLIKTHPKSEDKFNAYPEEVKKKLQHLRQLILETATEINTIKEVEETLKWGEPSYLVKKGSTIRIDWKPKMPQQYAMYFKCTSKLVLTFKEVYGDLFTYEKNRAIIFKMNDAIPNQALKECIRAALQYHRVKQLPRLGLENNNSKYSIKN